MGRELELFWRELWEQAGEALAATEDFAVIGYSMPAADEAARTLLFDHLARNARVSLWCGGSNAEIANEFSSRGFVLREPVGSGRFEDSLATVDPQKRY